MKGGTFILSLLIVTSLGLLSGVIVQERQLGRLRSEQQRLIAQMSGGVESGLAPATAAPEERLASPEVPFELLQLRNEANRLARRKQELNAARGENERLKQQLATSRTNRGGLPPGFLRKSEARMMGYQTPEATLQTFLWAMHGRNLTNLLETLTPEAVARINKPYAHRPPEEIFEGSEALVGLGVIESERMADGLMRLKLQLTPELPPANLTFRLIGNEWKMDWPPRE
jgi:hypothetical protein